MSSPERYSGTPAVEELLAAIDERIQPVVASVTRLSQHALDLEAGHASTILEARCIGLATAEDSGLRRLAVDTAREHREEEAGFIPALDAARSRVERSCADARGSAVASQQRLKPVRRLLASVEVTTQTLESAAIRVQAVEAMFNTSIEQLETAGDLFRAIARRQS